MCTIRNPLMACFLALVLGGIPSIAGAQDGKSTGRTIFIDPIQKGLADAREKMNDEQFLGCFTTAFFVDEFAKRATSQETGQSMSEMLEKFICSVSERISDDRYEVTGWVTVNGETGPITSEIIRDGGEVAGDQVSDDSSWAVGRFLLVGKEVFRDPAYTPAN